MTPSTGDVATLDVLDGPTRELVTLAAVVVIGSEDQVRRAMAAASRAIPPGWIEELLLQTYLFAGFPRALNATREWRRFQPAPPVDSGSITPEHWRALGEATCAAVYGSMYERLRKNIRGLHPALDDWMILEGYGKVLSRPGLDLQRRELCIVAACAAAEQNRQLHSHLHGALTVGVGAPVIEAAIDTLVGIVSDDAMRSARLLWAHVRRVG